MLISSNKPDVVIWDWDGTLVDSAPVIFSAHNHVRTSLGFSAWTEEEFKEISYHSTHDIYPKLYDEKAEQGIEILRQFFEDIDPKKTPFIKGADDLVKLLKDMFSNMVVASNKQHDVLLKELGAASFRDCLLSAVGAGAAKKDKPDREVVFLALEKANIDLSSVQHAWFIGDTQTDVDCAQNLPFETCSIIIGDNDTRGEDYRFKDLVSFYDFLVQKRVK